jgi:hypothetical protein
MATGLHRRPRAKCKARAPACGELVDHPPIDLGNALTLGNVERAVRRTLQDVEMFRAMDPAERALPHCRARRVYLADKLRRLRERLGDAAER